MAEQQENLQNIFDKASAGQVKYLCELLDSGRNKGFENLLNRKHIWPFLLGVKKEYLEGAEFQWQTGMKENSSDFDQLQKDAERSLASMKTFQNITRFHLKKRQNQVLKVLDHYFARNKEFRYIQGFHDVASIFLVLFGTDKGYYMMQQAGNTFFRDFLTEDIGTLGIIFSQLIMEILVKEDQQFKQLFECFQQTKMMIFIIPWVLTWFSHVFSSVKIVCRIWDYLLCTGPRGIILLTAAIIIQTKDDFKSKNDEIDQATIHTYYQKMTSDETIDIEASIKIALKLEEKFNFQKLSGFSNFSKNSIFINENFELKIDLHRQAKQYKKKEYQKAKNIRNLLVLGAFLIGVGVLAVKKLHLLDKLRW